MATNPNFHKHKNDLTIPQGRMFISKDQGVNKSFLYVGATSSANLSTEISEIDLKDGDSGIFQNLDSTPTDIVRTVTFVGNDMSDDNLSLLLTGETNTIIQEAGTGLTSGIFVSALNSFHVVGVTDVKPMGDTNIVVASVIHTASDVWIAETPKAVGQQIVVGTQVWQCVQSGETGAAEPTWGTPVLGDEKTDGDVKWAYVSVKTLTLDTHFYVNEEKGTIRILDIAPIYVSKVIPSQTYTVTYARSKTQRKRINTTIQGAIEGSIRLEQQNVKGGNKIWYFPKVSMKVTGDLNLKSNEAAYQEFTVECKVLMPETGAAVYVDGAAVIV
jgi:hypothetical protein